MCVCVCVCVFVFFSPKVWLQTCRIGRAAWRGDQWSFGLCQLPYHRETFIVFLFMQQQLNKILESLICHLYMAYDMMDWKSFRYVIYHSKITFGLFDKPLHLIFHVSSFQRTFNYMFFYETYMFMYFYCTCFTHALNAMYSMISLVDPPP